MNAVLNHFHPHALRADEGCSVSAVPVILNVCEHLLMDTCCLQEPELHAAAREGNPGQVLTLDPPCK